MSESQEITEEIAGSGRRQYRGWMAWVVKILSAIVPVYSIFYTLNITNLYFDIHFFATAYRALFLFLILALVFLLFPATKKATRDRLPWYDFLLILIALVPTLYELPIASEIGEGIKSGATTLEQVLFVVLMVLLFEAVRRTVGWAVLIVIMVSFLYANFAFVIPGLWGAPRFSFERLTEYMYLYDTGIFGMILGIGSTIVILFVTFGAFLINAGTAKLLMDGAMALAGRWRGGPAKVAVISSAAMATISGSGSANAGTTGAITIPLMKKIGYKPHFAAAVEAVASTGGMITPPVMGAIAFIMAEITGLGYRAVIVAAILPAVLYYIALYFQLDFEAAKLKLVGLTRDQLPSFRKALKAYWHLLIPIILLIILLVMRFDVLTSVIRCIGAVVIVSWFRKGTRMGFGKIIDALAQGTQGVIMVIVAMGAVGIIFGAVTLTGIGINLSVLIRDAAGGNLFLLAILTWIVVYASGMAIGELVVYIVMAVIVVPAFLDMGVPVLAAHMFIFLAGVSMLITPPNCPVVFVTCSIAGSGIWRTGFQAMKLAIVVFLVPFMLILNPVLILDGPPREIILAFITCIAAAYFLASGIVGYFIRELTWWQRLFFIIGGVALFVPGWQTDVVGLPIVLIAAFIHYVRWRRAKLSSVLPS